MQIQLSLSQLFFEAFGYQTDAFDPKFDKLNGDNKFSRVETGRHGSPYYATDLLGREYYLPIEVQVGNDPIPGEKRTYAAKFGVKNNDGSYAGRWNLPYPVISAISLKPHIIDTELTERDGMVSELINLSGYEITVRGFLFNKSNEFPEDDFDTLNRLVKLKIPVRINNPLTDILFAEINPDKTVSIRDLHFPERPGVKHVRPYELILRSEIPFNLIDIS